MNTTPTPPPRRRRGLTLLELAIAMAVMAILGALAVPSMAARLRAERLLAAAELYAADIADARHEAARRGQALHVAGRALGAPASASSPSVPAWCWSVATHAGCACGDGAGGSTPDGAPEPAPAAAPACRLKTVPAGDHPGVTLVQAHPVQMQPDGQATPALAAVFAAGERQLHVQVSRFGRARVCDPAGSSSRVARC